MLAIVFGHGKAAEEVYSRRKEFSEDCIFISVCSEEHDLYSLDSSVVNIDLFDIECVSKIVNQYQITELSVIGSIWNSVPWTKPSRYWALAKILCNAFVTNSSKHQNRILHALLMYAESYLGGFGVTISPISRHLNGLTGMSGESIGGAANHNVQSILAEAKQLANLADNRKPFAIKQSHIFGVNVARAEFKLLKSEANGTDRIIKSFRNKGMKAHEEWDFIKFVKVSIDELYALDSPVFGIDTARKCFEAGIRCAILEAGSVLMFQKEEIVRYCEKTGFKIHFV